MCLSGTQSFAIVRDSGYYKTISFSIKYLKYIKILSIVVMLLCEEKG